MAVDPDERVRIEHPDLPYSKKNPPIVSRGSLEEVWRNKGWVLHKPATKKGDK